MSQQTYWQLALHIYQHKTVLFSVKQADPKFLKYKKI